MRASGQLPLIPASNHVDIGSNIQLKYLQYEVDFYKAYATFYHQVVFDPLLMKVMFHAPYHVESDKNILDCVPNTSACAAL